MKDLLELLEDKIELDNIYVNHFDLSQYVELDVLQYFKDRFEKVKDDELIDTVTQMPGKRVKALALLNKK